VCFFCPSLTLLSFPILSWGCFFSLFFFFFPTWNRQSLHLCPTPSCRAAFLLSFFCLRDNGNRNAFSPLFFSRADYGRHGTLFSLKTVWCIANTLPADHWCGCSVAAPNPANPLFFRPSFLPFPLCALASSFFRPPCAALEALEKRSLPFDHRRDLRKLPPGVVCDCPRGRNFPPPAPTKSSFFPPQPWKSKNVVFFFFSNGDDR